MFEGSYSQDRCTSLPYVLLFQVGLGRMLVLIFKVWSEKLRCVWKPSDRTTVMSLKWPSHAEVEDLNSFNV